MIFQNKKVDTYSIEINQSGYKKRVEKWYTDFALLAWIRPAGIPDNYNLSLLSGDQ